MINAIKKYCDELIEDFSEIPTERREALNVLTDYIKNKKHGGEDIKLLYVCTHNSRRSQFGQVWAKVATEYFSIDNISSFSGGTEVTAFNANAIDALNRIGFVFKSKDSDTNPNYSVYYGETKPPLICFSKLYNNFVNPTSGFAAVMTCSEAEKNCPFVAGADLRLALPYNDPKEYDNSPLREAKYDECCRRIALEALYVFFNLKHIK